MELPFTCIGDLGISAIPPVHFDNQFNIGFEPCGFICHLILEKEKYFTAIEATYGVFCHLILEMKEDIFEGTRATYGIFRDLILEGKEEMFDGIETIYGVFRYLILERKGAIFEGTRATYGLFRDLVLERKREFFKVKYIGGTALCLSMCAVVWLKWTRRKVLCLEASPSCSSLFENFFYSACPWYRYELQWIQKHTSVSFSLPLLVVFRSTASLKGEVDATLENVTHTNNIMLIAMHNCEPTLRPTKQLRSCEDKRVISFTDILTWNDFINDCPTNEKAKNDIRLYLGQND
ncbi:uncharacterized protein LOC125654240 [Ostrea edulis]|uniref:uncharacterized protein LOC125654240 n=1 Tax=Ostrea edulis TaxID=37623 RepID=UPI0024AF2C0D|nr:uncharacterized protein LOC125654240 [Ostrea edulis]